MIAALYIDTARGPYVGMPGVEPWGWADKRGAQLDAFATTRDATVYAGPWPVVAHPPCGPWGRFRRRYLGGEGDAQAGVRAIEQARRWGGVVEHPAHTTLWGAVGAPSPGAPPDQWGGGRWRSSRSTGATRATSRRGSTWSAARASACRPCRRPGRRRTAWCASSATRTNCRNCRRGVGT